MPFKLLSKSNVVGLKTNYLIGSILVIISLNLKGNFDSLSLRYTKTLSDTVFVIGDLIRVPEIRFGVNSDLVNDQQFLDSLTVLINFFERNPFLVAEIVTHTDCRGSDDANINLSLKQSQYIVENILKSSTIIDERLTAVGKGESDPIYSCDFINTFKNDKAKFEQYHQINRRTEIRITGFMHPDFYSNHRKASEINGLSDTRKSAYYEDIILLADKVLLDGDYFKAMYFYQKAVILSPIEVNYAQEQLRKLQELIEANTN